MIRHARRLSLLALLAGAGIADAAPERGLPSTALYVRARAAEVGDDMTTADAGFAQLLMREPADGLIAQRAYRQAMASGDMALALRAARLLDRAHALPPDGRLLLVVDAIRGHDWAAARAQTDLVARERLFAFMEPMLRAWIAVGSRQGDPQAALDAARGLTLAQPYIAEQRALLLFAAGRTDDGVAAIRRAGTSDIAAWPVRVRLLAADALDRAGQKDRALGLLDGDDPALETARAILKRGDRLDAPGDRPAAALAELLVRVATDLGRQQLASVGLALAREATLLDPRDAGTWLTCANLLGALKQQRAALDALGHVDADDPFASAARSLRVSLLSDMGDDQAALDDALKGIAHGGDITDWSRLGDVYLAMARAGDAATAYRKAIADGAAVKAPPTQIWPLYLQLGAALDLANDWPGAKQALTAALALAPDQPLVLNQFGYSLIARRDAIDRGSALIARASALRPDDPAITDSLGWSHYLLGRTTQAVPLLEKASAADPAEPTISEHLGDAYWAVGRLYEARYAWRAALVTAENKDRARLSSKIDLGLTPATASP